MRPACRMLVAGLILAMLATAPPASSRPAVPQSQAPSGPQPPSAPSGKEPLPAPVPTEESKPSSVISVESALVTVDVLVTDDDGRVLTALKSEHFRILDNEQPQRITNFAPVDAPITIVLLMEYSQLASDYFAYKAAYWGSDFLSHLESRDWVALVTYDLRPAVRVDFTHNKAEVQDALYSLGYPPFHETNMFDAILDTLDRLQPIKGKKSVLLLATGYDTFSEHTLDDTYKRLKETDATVFCIGIAEREFGLSEAGGIGYFQAKNQLETFSRLTGGIAWFPRFQGELPSIFESVTGFLRNQYALGFSPPASARDGKYHKLTVQVVGADGRPLTVVDQKGKRHKVIVHAREGYMASKGQSGK